jgi:MFS transporter, putative metabolite:H+ symporter
VADEQRGRSDGAITFRRPAAFWLGMLACSTGVVLHLPMYIGARDNGYRLAGMQPDPPMLLGMALIVVGLVATTYGLLPSASGLRRRQVARVRVQALDDARVKGAHVGLLLVMAAAVTIDVMKPTTLAFVAPGVAREYGLRSALNPHAAVPVALLPLAGITGTVVGSLIWGWLGDRIGRRASILLAGVLFIVTAICGAMPGFAYNLVMCFIMGLGVGGMLPIMFALMAETIPARHRGWLMVLVGGDVIGAYIVTSWLAAELVPVFSWRILWLIGALTGGLLIVLNRWIPESPRFLLASGRQDEARTIMERYGAAVAPDEVPELAIEDRVRAHYGQLFRPPFLGVSSVVLLLGIGVGLVTFGFQLWIPTNLQKLGFSEVTANRVLRDSAIIGFPLNFAVAWLYGFWSSKRTIILLAAVTAAALVGFIVAGDAVVRNRALLYALLVPPIWGISSMVAALTAYGSEVYPTRVRSHGTALAAGASKAGGVAIIALVALSVAAPSIAVTALLGALPLALAVLAIGLFGVETRGRRLEEITAQELRAEAG